MNVEDRLIKTVVKANQDFPFFGYLLLWLRREPKPEVGTIAVTEHGRMWYNPEFLERMTDDELLGVLSHEIMHVVLGHLNRKWLGSRNLRVCNIAQDIVINQILVSSELKLPKGALIPNNDQLTLQGNNITIKDISSKSWEEVYDELYKKLPKIKIMMGTCPKCGGSGKISDKKGDGNGKNKKDKQEDEKGGNFKPCPDCGKRTDGGFDIHIREPAGGKDKKDKDDKEIPDWGNILVDATSKARQARGTIPNGMERYIEELSNPKLNWRTLLQRHVTNSLPSDLTWSKPSKRSFSTGVYMPGIKRENIDVVIAVDTSGSVSAEDLRDFLSEMIGIGRSFSNIRMTAISADAKVHESIEVTNGNTDKIMNWKPKGGGGTSHGPVLSHIKDNIQDCKIAIFMSDGYSDQQSLKAPDYEVIWVLTKDGCDEKDITWGRVIRLND